MEFQRLKWVAISAPIVFIGLLEIVHFAWAPTDFGWRFRVLTSGVAMVAAVWLYRFVCSKLDRVQDKLESRNHELRALYSSGLDVTAELDLDSLLQKVVARARKLLGARYGALAVYDRQGDLKSFVTSGMSEDVAARIGPPPEGRGLFGIVMREGQRLRTAEVGDDPRFSGFPDNHPPMHSLLAVPVICRSPFRGNLYLSETMDGSEFTAEHEETLVRFATQTAIAVDNAHLHAQVRNLAVSQERMRIAREMHDGQAQVLAYVNTKAQAVQKFLESGKVAEANEHLSQLAVAAREVYADVREGILGLRAIVDSESGFTETLRRHLERWQEQSGIRVELVVSEELPRFATDVELQLLRIFQEALANVRKHSQAETVKVELKALDGGAKLSAEDRGTGFDLDALRRSQRPRFGIATMRERAEAVGASLDLKSQPGVGTRVEVKYPGARKKTGPRTEISE